MTSQQADNNDQDAIVPDTGPTADLPAAGPVPANDLSAGTPALAGDASFSKEEDRDMEKPSAEPDSIEGDTDLFSKTEKLMLSHNYEWMEKREPVMDIIRLVTKSRVLFIKAPNIHVVHLAIQRFSVVLQTSRHLFFESPVRVRINRQREPLSNYFWKDFHPCKEPVFLVLYYDYQEQLKNLLFKDSLEVDTDIRRKLEEKNIFIICPLPDIPENKIVLEDVRAKQHLKENYVLWNVPAFKLELARRYQKEGIEIYDELTRRYGTAAMEDNTSYHFLQKIPETVLATGFIAEFDNYKNEYINSFRDDVKHLTAIINGNDLILQMLLFAGAFFPGIESPDFMELIKYLLGEEKEYISPGKKETDKPRLLKDIWAERVWAQQYMQTAMLKTMNRDRAIVIGFKDNELGENIRKIIKADRLDIYYSVFEHISAQGLLFNPQISIPLRRAIINFIVAAAQSSASYHHPGWLQRLFFMNLREVLGESIAEDEILQQIIEAEPELISEALLAKVLVHCGDNSLLKKSIVEGLSVLFSEMFKAEDRVFEPALNQFIRKLSSLYRWEKTSLDIVLPIYNVILKNYELTDSEEGNDEVVESQLTRKGLIKYFSVALEQGDMGQMFYAYDKLLQYFGRRELLKICNDWVDDATLSAKSWTKKFAWLFQLDFCVYSIDNYFSKAKKAGYELFAATPVSGIDTADFFSAEFKQILKHITSPDFIECSSELLHHKNAFFKRAFWLEHDVTGIKPLGSRFEEENAQLFTLSADVLENWFYILETATGENNNQEDTRQSYIAALIIELADSKILKQITGYWRRKLVIYVDTVADLAAGLPGKVKREEKTSVIKLRRGSLRKLADLITKQLSK